MHTETISTSSQSHDNQKYELVSKQYKIINKKYLCFLNYVIGSGTFGKVIYSTNMDQNVEYAIKFEKTSVKTTVIDEEIKIYKDLAGGEGIPNVHWTGEYKKYKLIVMDILSPSLDKFFISCDKKFTLATTIHLTQSMINRVEYVHSKGYIHRDIKPNNFMLGRFSKKLEYITDTTVYIIDFGLSKEFIDFETKEHLPFRDNRRFIGTPRYASINTHSGIRQSRRDDLESIAYIMIYFLLGELPWQGVKAKNKAEKKEKIREMKVKTDFNDNKIIPKEFKMILNYCKSLKYEETPDYKLVYSLFKKLKEDNNILEVNDPEFIWQWNENFLLNKKGKSLSASGLYTNLYQGYPVPSYNEYHKKLMKFYDGKKVMLNNDVKSYSTLSNVKYNYIDDEMSDDDNE